MRRFEEEKNCLDCQKLDCLPCYLEGIRRKTQKCEAY
jgi:hypothetical protein